MTSKKPPAHRIEIVSAVASASSTPTITYASLSTLPQGGFIMSNPSNHATHQVSQPASNQVFQPRWITTDEGLIVPEASGGMLVPPPSRAAYKVVLADPPWDVFQKSKHGAGEHYDLMTLKRISELGEAIKYLANEQSFCFMWVTTATLPYGAQLLEDWGFTYKSFYSWIKPRFTLGGYFRNAAELLLLGVKGKGIKFQFRSQPNWGMYPLQDHSRKPEEIHQMIERVAGPGRYLELFARRPSPTAVPWDVWGNEVDASISLAPWGFEVPSDFTPKDIATDTSGDLS